MRVIRNLFAFIGFVVVVGAVAVAVRYSDQVRAVQSLDRKAGGVYLEMADTLLETGDAAAATVWKFPVEEGLTPEDVEQTMKFAANEHNFANVGELPLSRQVELMTEKPFPYLKIFMFCNPLTAAKMVSHSIDTSAYLPCRIILAEDAAGRLWLISLNLDMMIYGGRPLPPELKEEALKVREVILDIMQRGASGAF